MDPTFQAGVKGYVSEAGKRVGEASYKANSWGKNAFGVDVAEQVGGVVGTVKDRVAGGPERRGYSSVGAGGYAGETSSLYQDHEDDDEFFDSFQSSASHVSDASSPTPLNGGAGTASGTKKSDDWDEWKDF